MWQSTISKCFEKCGFSQQISEETISDSKSANDDNRPSNIQDLISHFSFEDEPANAELFINFDSDIPMCNISVDLGNKVFAICLKLKKKLCILKMKDWN